MNCAHYCVDKRKYVVTEIELFNGEVIDPQHMLYSREECDVRCYFRLDLYHIPYFHTLHFGLLV